MAQTLITTATRIFGSRETFEQMYDADPACELELTDEQREEFGIECRDHLVSEYERILGQVDPTVVVLANGEIIADEDGTLDGMEFDSTEWEDIKEELGMIDFDDIIAKYLG